MNAPPRLSPPDGLLADALDRLAHVAASAGHESWNPPAVPVDADRLAETVMRFTLSRGEALALALLLAAECDASVARMIGAIQAPVGGARALAGLLATLFASEGVTPVSLWSGPATRNGLVTWGDEAAPLPERSLAVPAWIAAALAGHISPPPGIIEPAQPDVLLPDRMIAAAEQEGDWLAGTVDGLLVLRAACPAEGESLAKAAAAPSGFVPCHLIEAEAPGLGAWLAIAGRIPVIHRSAGPGEGIDLAVFDRLPAPLILVAGAEGQVLSARRRREWRAPVPEEGERRALWQRWGLGDGAAAAAAARFRQGAGRIAEIGRSLPGPDADLATLGAVMRGGGGRIDGLARRTSAHVRRGDIVLTAELGQALDRLRDRIQLRNRLAGGLGPTITARYRPGVRALFTGESGTGKTLAVHWLAEQAGLPCYRVDLAALTSKWIGETEKNLSQLLDAAEQGDVVLFFDEADALFGSRTDVGDAHDRHANAQTNYLLQRIEDFEGVALLATNSRDRFDPAFVRRLDMVLEFPMPDAGARRLLWDRHLGEQHAIAPARLDQVAAVVDLAGGHVRNVVLAAAARAKAADRPIAAGDLDAAIAEEYAKLGRTAPPLAPG